MTVETVPGPGIFATPPRGKKIDDLESVTRFIQRYKNLKDAQAWRHVENFKEAFNGLRPEMTGMLAEANEKVRLHAPNFNLFRLLHLEAREDELHTPLVAELLNPRGVHGQEFLFLRTFINAMQQSHSQFPSPGEDFEQHTWFVETQKYTGQGTLDIVVSCPALSYLVVFENEVYAGEQPDQLERYTAWMHDNSEYYPTQALIYLTPTGEPSETADRTTYYTASYRGQIAGMLRNALPGISAPHLREIILQYLDVIQKI
ncbi:MAG: PD-(D/E)XK nuclease family protein [Fidelibacterota bacterium]|nr:MAG: PD-(D/E)XK nuclease family protein [Candidatus Neomarinimicrobiota bacterium]